MSRTRHSRPQRRADRARMISRAADHVRVFALDLADPADAELANRNVRRFADNMATCSCSMCGNPRRHFGQLTRPERLAMLSQREQLDDLPGAAGYR